MLATKKKPISNKKTNTTTKKYVRIQFRLQTSKKYVKQCNSRFPFPVIFLHILALTRQYDSCWKIDHNLSSIF